MLSPFARNTTGIGLLVILLLGVAGCGNGNERADGQKMEQQSSRTAENEQSLLQRFAVLQQAGDSASLQQAIRFVDENISAVSAKNASAMVLGLEKAQQRQLVNLAAAFTEAEQAVQQALAGSYPRELTDAYIAGISNPTVKTLLMETKNGGFKIETAEGMYFPVIDYALYRQYHGAVTPDIAAYIDIMAVEGAKTPARDAALVIGWEEVLQRALRQEQFLAEHTSSERAGEVRELLKRYTLFALYGLNNTPLFEYETGRMNAKARAAYRQELFTAGKGAFSLTMKEYLDLLSKNNYELTDQIQDFRRKAMDRI